MIYKTVQEGYRKKGRGGKGDNQKYTNKEKYGVSFDLSKNSILSKFSFWSNRKEKDLELICQSCNSGCSGCSGGGSCSACTSGCSGCNGCNSCS